MDTPKRILIVEVNWIGDVLFSTPFIRAVREAYPDAHIAALIHPRCRQMLEANPRVDEIIVYDEEISHRTLIGKAALVMELRRKRFDTAFVLHRSFTKALLTFLAGIRERIGYPTKGRGWVLTCPAEEPDADAHKVEYFLGVARSAGIRPRDNSYEFFVTDEDRARIDSILAKEGVGPDGNIIVFCPGGNWDPKRWPAGNFAGLGDALAARPGTKIVIAAAGKDARLAEEIAAGMRARPVVVAGKTSLKELGALLARAGLVVANDTGPMHMAVAMKAKTIALFGPTSPEITGPYGAGKYRVVRGKVGCDVPCYDVTCRDNRCMKSITVGEVLKAAGELLGK